jgi:hypothetical protein
MELLNPSLRLTPSTLSCEPDKQSKGASLNRSCFEKRNMNG